MRLTKTWIRQTRRDLVTELEKTAAHYGAKDIPENVQQRLEKLVAATTREEVIYHAHRARRALETHLLVAWGRGKIPGPRTPKNLMRKAEKLESLARMHEKQGREEQARAAKSQAVKLRQEAAQGGERMI